MSRRRTELSFSLFAFQDIITAVTGISLLIAMILALALIHSRRQTTAAATEPASENLESRLAELRGEVDVVRRQLADQQTLSLRLAQLTPDQTARRTTTTARSVAELETQTLALERRVEASRRDWESNRQRELAALARLEGEDQDANRELNHLQEQLAEMRTSNRYFFNPASGGDKRPWLVEVTGAGILISPADGGAPPRSFSSSSDFFSGLKDLSSRDDYFVLFVHPSGIGNFQSLQMGLGAHEYGVDLVGEDTRVVPAR